VAVDAEGLLMAIRAVVPGPLGKQPVLLHEKGPVIAHDALPAMAVLAFINLAVLIFPVVSPCE
jgi:hypothetical protein